jgi:hypothetical protein
MGRRAHTGNIHLGITGGPTPTAQRTEAEAPGAAKDRAGRPGRTGNG